MDIETPVRERTGVIPPDYGEEETIDLETLDPEPAEDDDDIDEILVIDEPTLKDPPMYPIVARPKHYPVVARKSTKELTIADTIKNTLTSFFAEARKETSKLANEVGSKLYMVTTSTVWGLRSIDINGDGSSKITIYNKSWDKTSRIKVTYYKGKNFYYDDWYHEFNDMLTVKFRSLGRFITVDTTGRGFLDLDLIFTFSSEQTRELCGGAGKPEEFMLASVFVSYVNSQLTEVPLYTDPKAIPTRDKNQETSITVRLKNGKIIFLPPVDHRYEITKELRNAYNPETKTFDTTMMSIKQDIIYWNLAYGELKYISPKGQQMSYAMDGTMKLTKMAERIILESDKFDDFMFAFGQDAKGTFMTLLDAYITESTGYKDPYSTIRWYSDTTTPQKMTEAFGRHIGSTASKELFGKFQKWIRVNQRAIKLVPHPLRRYSAVALARLLEKYLDPPSKYEDLVREIDERIEKVRSADYKDMAPVPGNLSEKVRLLPHQADVAGKISYADKTLVFSIGTGGGKTLMFIMDILYHLKDGSVSRPLMVMPPVLIPQWFNELHNFTDSKMNCVVIETDTMKSWGAEKLKSLVEGAPKNTIFVTTYKWLTLYADERVVGGRVVTTLPNVEYLTELGFDYVGLDESHHIKNEESKTHKACLALGQRATYKRIGTGTISPNTVVDLVGQMAFIDPSILGTKLEFLQKYGSEVENEKIAVFKPGAEKQIQDAVDQAGAIRKSRKDWFFVLPKIKDSFHIVELTENQRASYATMVATQIKPLFTGKDTKNSWQKFLSDGGMRDIPTWLLPKLNMLDAFTSDPGSSTFAIEGVLSGPDAESPKLRTVQQLLDKHFAKTPNEKVLILTQHKERVLPYFYDNLGPRYKPMAIKYSAGMQDNLDKFKNDPECKILVGCNRSLREGHNLQMASRMILLDVFWCVTGDTLINTEHGLIPIENLCSPDMVKGEIREFGSNVLTHKGIKKASHIYKTEAPTITIKTSHGYGLEGSYKHPVKVLTKEFKLKWKQLKDIQEGDYVCINRTKDIWPRKAPKVHIDGNLYPNVKEFKAPERITPKIGRLLGYLTADGGHFVFYNSDKQVISDYIDCCKEFEGYDPSWYNGKKNTKDKLVPGVRYFKEYCKAAGYNECRAYEKEIPWSIMQSPKEVVREFLRGYYEGDGSPSKQEVYCWSTSYKLVRQIQTLLLNFGIISKIREGGYKSHYERNCWDLCISNKWIHIFREEIGFISDRKKDKLEKICKKSVVLSDKGKWNYSSDCIPYWEECIRPAIEGKAVRRNVYTIGSGKHCRTTTVKAFTCNRRGHTTYDFILSEDNYERLENLAKIHPELFNQIYKVLKPNFYFDPVVVKKENTKPKVLYDLTIPDVHAFISNGIVSHNSPGDVDQLIARVYRFDPGDKQREIVNIDWVLANNTIDVLKFRRVIAKFIQNNKADGVIDENDMPSRPLFTVTEQGILGDSDWRDAQNAEAIDYNRLRELEAVKWEQIRKTLPAESIAPKISGSIPGDLIDTPIPYGSDIPSRDAKVITVDDMVDDTYNGDTSKIVGHKCRSEFGKGIVVHCKKRRGVKGYLVRIDYGDDKEEPYIVGSTVQCYEEKNPEYTTVKYMITEPYGAGVTIGGVQYWLTSRGMMHKTLKKGNLRYLGARYIFFKQSEWVLLTGKAASSAFITHHVTIELYKILQKLGYTFPEGYDPYRMDKTKTRKFQWKNQQWYVNHKGEVGKINEGTGVYGEPIIFFRDNQFYNGIEGDQLAGFTPAVAERVKQLLIQLGFTIPPSRKPRPKVDPTAKKGPITSPPAPKDPGTREVTIKKFFIDGQQVAITETGIIYKVFKSGKLSDVPSYKFDGIDWRIGKSGAIAEFTEATRARLDRHLKAVGYKLDLEEMTKEELIQFARKKGIKVNRQDKVSVIRSIVQKFIDNPLSKKSVKDEIEKVKRKIKEVEKDIREKKRILEEGRKPPIPRKPPTLRPTTPPRRPMAPPKGMPDIDSMNKGQLLDLARKLGLSATQVMTKEQIYNEVKRALQKQGRKPPIPRKPVSPISRRPPISKPAPRPVVKPAPRTRPIAPPPSRPARPVSPVSPAIDTMNKAQLLQLARKLGLSATQVMTKEQIYYEVKKALQKQRKVAPTPRTRPIAPPPKVAPVTEVAPIPLLAINMGGVGCIAAKVLPDTVDIIHQKMKGYRFNIFHSLSMIANPVNVTYFKKAIANGKITPSRYALTMDTLNEVLIRYRKPLTALNNIPEEFTKVVKAMFKKNWRLHPMMIIPAYVNGKIQFIIPAVRPQANQNQIQEIRKARFKPTLYVVRYFPMAATIKQGSAYAINILKAAKLPIANLKEFRAEVNLVRKQIS